MEWTWMGGTQGETKMGIYGTRGVASPQNRPSARENHTVTKDNEGNVWLFGGVGYPGSGTPPPEVANASGPLNDLWKWDAATGYWTWMGGADVFRVSAVHGALGESHSDYMPASRESATLWADNAGNIWLYGGTNYSDVWKFDTSSLEWALMRGPVTREDELPVHGTLGVPHADNTPGARVAGGAWSDDEGNLWVFGGRAAWDDPDSSFSSTALYSDFWKYDISTNEWVWFDGPAEPAQYGDYGTKGMAASSNWPGARLSGAYWRDSVGNFWLFGGTGHTESANGSLNDLWKYDVAQEQWTWVSGSSDINPPAVYGTRGTPHPDNHPGRLSGPAGWSDAHDNFWIFGGYGNIRRMNTLWRFNPDTNQWTWVSGGTEGNEPNVFGEQGVMDEANHPSGRNNSVGWSDDDGSIRVFGGLKTGYSSTELRGDLWRYDLDEDASAWEGGDGPANYATYGTEGVEGPEVWPGATIDAASWSDSSGNLWLYGGGSYNERGSTNGDALWKYNVNSGQWAFMGGSLDVLVMPVHGELGVAHPDNTPGGRSGASTWTANNGNVYLFGGHVVNDPFNVINRVYRNDLWRFDPVSGNWTWIHGNPDSRTQPEYGEKGVAAPENIPGGRENAAAWMDADGNLWVFGGYGVGVGTSTAGQLNDLWKYDLSTGLWTWISGGNSTNDFSNYGQQGESNEFVVPGARQGAVAWADNAANLWLFGGYGYAKPGSVGALNDLWRYNIASGHWTWMHGSEEANSMGDYGTRGIAEAENLPGARTGAGAWKSPDGRFWLFGGTRNPYYSRPNYNDVWLFDPADVEWTWIHGSQDLDELGNYGQVGVADAANAPGGRTGFAAWTDPQGNFWMFGGVGYGATDRGIQQDLWMFSTGSDIPLPTAAQLWELYD